MEGEVKNIRKYFNEVTSKFDELRVMDLAGLSKAFNELEDALYKFDAELDSFLNEIKEENKDE